MKSAILHVGLHKTGTTSIQSSLCGYDNGDTLYADLGAPNHSRFFQTLFRKDNLARWWTDNGLSAKEHQELIGEYERILNKQLSKKHSRIIFSGEEISDLDAEALQRLKSHFNNHYRQITAVVFVREPLSMTASLMQEHAKWGVFLQNANTDGQLVSFRIFERVDNIVKVFGRESTQIHYYEDARSSQYPRGVIDYFAELIDIHPSGLQIPKASNQSIGETTYKLLNAFFQSDIVHRKGAMLNTARWHFIRMLEEAVNTTGKRKLDINAFRSKVDWEDYKRLNTLLNKPYPIEDHKAGGPEFFSDYCNDIDHAEVCKNLSSYLDRKALPAPANCNTHELICLLFYKAIQDHATQPVYRQLHARQERIKHIRNPFLLAKKLKESMKKLSHKASQWLIPTSRGRRQA